MIKLTLINLVNIKFRYANYLFYKLIWILFVLQYLKIFQVVRISSHAQRNFSRHITILKSAKHHKNARHQLWYRKNFLFIYFFVKTTSLEPALLLKWLMTYISLLKQLNTNLIVVQNVQFTLPITYKIPYLIFAIFLIIYLTLFLVSALLVIKYFVMFWLVLVGMFLQVMVFTACERKMLALIQRRTGPVIIGTRGRLQCIADSLKLLLKVYVSAKKINSLMFQVAAFGGFWISWYNFGNLTYGPGLDIMDVEYNIFFMLSVAIIFSLMWLLAGWSATSKYSMLGCFRASIQFLSFEIIMSTVLLIIFVLFSCFNFELIVDMQVSCPLALCCPTLAIVTLFAFFIETNRPPFDLSEAESDVVAGYNVEYSGILFGLFYLGEYLNLFAACSVLILLFCAGWLTPHVPVNLPPYFAFILPAPPALKLSL